MGHPMASVIAEQLTSWNLSGWNRLSFFEGINFSWTWIGWKDGLFLQSDKRSNGWLCDVDEWLIIAWMSWMRNKNAWMKTKRENKPEIIQLITQSCATCWEFEEQTLKSKHGNDKCETSMAKWVDRKMVWLKKCTILSWVWDDIGSCWSTESWLLMVSKLLFDDNGPSKTRTNMQKVFVTSCHSTTKHATWNFCWGRKLTSNKQCHDGDAVRSDKAPRSNAFSTDSQCWIEKKLNLATFLLVVCCSSNWQKEGCVLSSSLVCLPTSWFPPLRKQENARFKINKWFHTWKGD